MAQAGIVIERSHSDSFFEGYRQGRADTVRGVVRVAASVSLMLVMGLVLWGVVFG